MSILYTVVPLELIWEGIEDETVDNIEIPIENGSLIVEPLSLNHAKIVRVISSNPQVFLDPLLQPGKTIEFILKH